MEHGLFLVNLNESRPSHRIGYSFVAARWIAKAENPPVEFQKIRDRPAGLGADGVF